MTMYRTVGGGKLLSDADPKTIGPENCKKRINIRRKDDAEILFPGWVSFGGARTSVALNIVGSTYDGVVGVTEIPGNNLVPTDVIDVILDDGTEITGIVEEVNGDTVTWVNSDRVYVAPEVQPSGSDFESDTTSSIQGDVYQFSALALDEQDFEGDNTNSVSVYVMVNSPVVVEEDFESVSEPTNLFAIGEIAQEEQDFETDQPIDAYLNKLGIDSEGEDFENVSTASNLVIFE